MLAMRSPYQGFALAFRLVIWQAGIYKWMTFRAWSFGIAIDIGRADMQETAKSAGGLSGSKQVSCAEDISLVVHLPGSPVGRAGRAMVDVIDVLGGLLQSGLIQQVTANDPNRNR